MGRTTRLLLGVMAGLAGAVALAAPAAAHVTVNPDRADPGSYTRVAFRVPTESDTAGTTKVQVFLPTGNAVASVSVAPVPGWTVAVHHKKLSTPLATDDGDVTTVVSDILWTAGASAVIKPGQFQEFPVSLGPLPKSGALTFKALQTYSDGSIVRWIDTGSADAEHPAPVLTIGAASPPAAAPTAVAARTGTSGTSAGTALAVAVVGLVVAALGLVLGGLAFARSRRSG